MPIESILVFAATMLLAFIVLVALMERLSDHRLGGFVVIAIVGMAIALIVNSVFWSGEPFGLQPR
jgi:FtsH-binding integral membrane protein